MKIVLCLQRAAATLQGGQIDNAGIEVSTSGDRHTLFVFEVRRCLQLGKLPDKQAGQLGEVENMQQFRPAHIDLELNRRTVGRPVQSLAGSVWLR